MTEYGKEGGGRMPDRETQEKRQHSTTWIPYSYYECRLPEWFANVPVHWHSEFELIHIRQGRGEFICGSRKRGNFCLCRPTCCMLLIRAGNGRRQRQRSRAAWGAVLETDTPRREQGH